MALSDYTQQINDAALANGLEPSILTALINKESGGNAYALGAAGEIGLGQLKSSTALDLGINPWIPSDNIKGAAKYLAQQIKATGNIFDGLRAYNAGLGGSKDNPNAGAGYATDILNAAKQDSPLPTLASDTKAAANSVTGYAGSIVDGIKQTINDLIARFLVWIKAASINIFIVVAAVLAIFFSIKKMAGI